MKDTVIRSFIGLVTMAVPLQSFGWGDQGHKAIWAAAQTQLTSKARQTVSEILNGDKLAMTAVWLDRARDAEKKHKGPLVGDPETDQFSAAFPDHPDWHFVNLPLGATAYENLGFSRTNDVVQQIELCIRVLEGTDTSLSKRIALRCLIHLVGDIHQPMHCISGYYDVSDPNHPRLVTDVAEARSVAPSNDRGANQLFFGRTAFDELHGLWDAELPKEAAGGSSSFRDLRDILEDDLAAGSCETSGDFHHWPEQWVVESVATARSAYKDIQFGSATLGQSRKIDRIEITLPEDYNLTFATVAQRQMSKAACRTATLLNRIFK